MKKSILSFFIFFSSIILLVVGYSLFQEPAGVSINCKTGEVIEFARPIGPPACIGCFPSCFAEIEVKLVNGTLICNSKESSFNSERIIVRCKNLLNYKKQTLYIKTNVTSDYGEHIWEGIRLYE